MLASDYLQLRVADELNRLFEATAKAYAESLRITCNQYTVGFADQSTVAQAETQLRSTEAQAIAVGVIRAQLEHAIAVLIGKPPAELSIAPTNVVTEVPEIPAGLPSALLERRPDIAAAERLMGAANAQIGVAEAAFYPKITLSADYGVVALSIAKLFTDQARFWAFGSSLAETVFDAGARAAIVEEARAFEFRCTQVTRGADEVGIDASRSGRGIHDDKNAVRRSRVSSTRRQCRAKRWRARR